MSFYKSTRVACVLAQMISICGCVPAVTNHASSAVSSDSTAVIITPVQHMGRRYTVEDVYVNGQIAGGAGRLGGGGGMSCCVLLPETWRAGLVAKVTWVVLDWEHENIEETKRGVHRSIKELGHFQAVVPIEYYKRPENLYLHFYDNGKVRAVSSLFDAFDSRHPVSFSAEENGSATAGKILKRE